MRLHPAMKSGERKVIPFRTATMSTQIVAQVRDALFAKELRSGDFLGTEKDLAERFWVSRIVARDALRTLEAQGVVEIKVGSGGGARIARGNARLFAEALAVQLDLAGVSVSEIMEAQRAIECPGAEIRGGHFPRRGSPSAALTDRRSRAQDRRYLRLYAFLARVPSRRRRSISQPRL